MNKSNRSSNLAVFWLHFPFYDNRCNYMCITREMLHDLPSTHILVISISTFKMHQEMQSCCPDAVQTRKSSEIACTLINIKNTLV